MKSDHFFLARFQDYSIRPRCAAYASRVEMVRQRGRSDRSCFPIRASDLDEHRHLREGENPMARNCHDSGDVGSNRDPYDATPVTFPTSRTNKELLQWVSRLRDPMDSFFRNSSEASVKKAKVENALPKMRVQLGNKEHSQTAGVYTLENGDSFEGNLVDGKLHGLGLYRFKNGTTLRGRFKSGYPNDWITRTEDEQYDFHEEFFEMGHGTGCLRRLRRHSRDLEFAFLDNNDLVTWREVTGRAFIVSKYCVVPEDEGAAASVSGKLYLYPDLRLALAGSFDNRDRVVEAREAIVVDVVDSVPVVRFLAGKSSIHFDAPSGVSMGMQPLHRDLCDHINCFVAQSRMSSSAGEGLFAKRPIPQHSLVALFSGVRKRRIFRDVPCSSSSEDWSDYSITLNKEISLDILPGMTDATRYCATVGHKACHSFEPSCSFQQLWHPRFGLIMSLVALRDLEPGEEITVHYRYPLVTAPRWYQALWRTYLRRHLGWSSEDVLRYDVAAHEVRSFFDTINSRIAERKRLLST